MNKNILTLGKVVLIAGVLGWAYCPTLCDLVQKWIDEPQYSHGFLVPIFALALLVRNRQAAVDRAGEPVRPLYWYGYGLLLIALSCRVIAALLFFLPLDALSFVLCLAALVMIVGGRSMFRQSWQSLVFLIFMIPLPYQVERMMGAELQHIATICTTFLLQTLGQPAIAEGNRILIQDVRLGVEEACSGLSMLMTFFAICVGAVMLLDRHWIVKALVLASAVPIALVANILRITATGMVLVWLADSSMKDRIFHEAHRIFGHLMIVLGMTFLVLELWLYKHLLIEPDEVVPSSKFQVPSRAH